MSEQEIIKWIGQHIITVLLVLSVFIQIAPIKLNPWSSLINWLARTLTDNLRGQMKEIEGTLSNISKNVDQNEKDRIRWQVLDFASSCREGRKHSKDQFQHIITLNDKYNKLLKRTGDQNGVFNAQYEYIQRIYKERQVKNDFI